MINVEAAYSSGLLIATGVYALASAFATVLPPSWTFTRVCARIALDLRGLAGKTPAPAPVLRERPGTVTTHITVTGDDK